MQQMIKAEHGAMYIYALGANPTKLKHHAARIGRSDLKIVTVKKAIIKLVACHASRTPRPVIDENVFYTTNTVELDQLMDLMKICGW